MERTLFEPEHDLFRDAFRAFADKELVPNHERWEAAGIWDREMFLTAGEHGFLGMAVPEEYGGGGVPDFRYNMVIGEEVQHSRASGSGFAITIHNDILVPYFLLFTDEEQKRRWLPGICSGELITAVAMTEPIAGSDLAGVATTAVRDGDSYVLNGSKTFISNGINADLVVVVAKTDPEQKHKGISLVVVERDTDGFERGRNLSKIGLHSQDTAELFFDDARIPAENLLGNEGDGFRYLMVNLAQERLSIAVAAVAASKAAFDWTLEYAKERRAFGQPIGTFQHNKFAMAEMATELEVAQTFVDRCVEALNSGSLTADEAAMAKWWTTELQTKIVDRCLQLHGGYGYMEEYPIAQAWRDARIQTIYGGTTEIMKEIVGRSLGL